MPWEEQVSCPARGDFNWSWGCVVPSPSHIWASSEHCQVRHRLGGVTDHKGECFDCFRLWKQSDVKLGSALMLSIRRTYSVSPDSRNFILGCISLATREMVALLVQLRYFPFSPKESQDSALVSRAGKLTFPSPSLWCWFR